MKRISKLLSSCLFAVLFYGCLPREKLTGRVIDTAGPVPEAAVLGMVWIEDADKASPKPDIKNLKSEDLDAALDKDMKDRGLPVAYARAFSDKDGRFTLDKLHFSAETKKAVKAMKQPKITRITLNAFQRGYLKHAATVFPKSAIEDLSPATVTLFRPESWKQLALDSSYVTLRRNEYDAGYSKEFGATKEEKEWFLEYTKSNLDKAYAESDIKGDKQWEEDCGHDYSDLLISTAGIYRNPASEKCNRLLHQMGVLREWKEEWLAHSRITGGRTEPHISAVKAVLDALGPEYAEVKANEGYIIAGVDEAENQQRKRQTNQNLRNGLNENKTGTEEAQRLYNAGDKAGAYKALGRTLYSQLPAEVRQGPLIAQLMVKTAPGITDAVSGFYLLMNKPLTAQLPNGDNGNHKDKPGYKVETTTETADTDGAVNNQIPVKKEGAQKILKLGGDEIDMEKVRAKYYIGVEVGSETRREMLEDHEVERTIYKKAYGQPNADYFVKVENNFVGSGDEYDEVKAKVELYSADGAMLLKKDFDNARISRINVIKNGVFLVDFEPYETQVSRKQEIYNADGKLLYESQGITEFTPSPQADYMLFIEKAGDLDMLKKLDSYGNLQTLSEFKEDALGIETFSIDGRYFIIIGGRRTKKIAPLGHHYQENKLFFYKDSSLRWTQIIEVEGFFGASFSKSSRYMIVSYEMDCPCKDIVSEDGEKYRVCKRGVERFKVFNTETQRIIYDGLKDEKLILEYKNETIKN